MSEEFNNLVFGIFSTRVKSAVHRYAEELENSGGYNMGIYITTRCGNSSNDIYLTFLSGHGEVPSITFMLAVREEIDGAFFDIFADIWGCYISKVITSWELEDCDIITRAIIIAKDGILIQNGETNNHSICKIVDGKRPDF